MHNYKNFHSQIIHGSLYKRVQVNQKQTRVIDCSSIICVRDCSSFKCAIVTYCVIYRCKLFKINTQFKHCSPLCSIMNFEYNKDERRHQARLYSNRLA